MYFQYINHVGEHTICRNILIDDALFLGNNGFFFKEIVSDFSLRQVDDFSQAIEYPTTLFASSVDFVRCNDEMLRNVDNKKIFIFNNSVESEKEHSLNISYITEDDIPLSINEWREKIITAERILVIRDSIAINVLTELISKLRIASRIKSRILARFPLSIKRLEREIARDVVFIPFSRVKFIGNRKVSSKLIKKCILCGIEVDGVPLSRQQIEVNIEMETITFKRKILQ